MAKESLECPICNAQLHIKINGQTGDTISFYLEKEDNDTNMILNLLHRYWRWKAEGEIPYHRNTSEKKGQYYYDNLNGDHIKYLPEEDAYEFNIQTFDSPEGDEWISGKFKYHEWDENKTKIEIVHILEKKYHD